MKFGVNSFNALKEVVMPYKEKEDQAAFLKSAAEYIRQLQVCFHCTQLIKAPLSIRCKHVKVSFSICGLLQ